MKDTLVTVYCLCDELLKALEWTDDRQAQMTTAEVMTVALTAAAFFGGCHDRSRTFLHEHGYLPRMLSKSPFNRRWHAIPEHLWQAVIYSLAEILRAARDVRQREGGLEASEPTSNDDREALPTPADLFPEVALVDRCPVPVCDNIRIRRCRIYRGEAYRGYCASKRRYFYGLRVHLVLSLTGQPLEFVLAPGSHADLTVLRRMTLDLPEGATLLADKGYTDYGYEEILQDGQITLLPIRKANAKRPFPAWIGYLQSVLRKRIETAFSQLTDLFPKSIHAVTARGFELKVACFVLAYAFLSAF
jgi:hypothetical protein